MKRAAKTISIAFIYLRLSNEDKRLGESGSITNQRKILENYCKAHEIVIANEFVDDDYSGGNFNRPGFQAMLKALDADAKVNTVITKDLSRLGRDMSESSYYAERYFPERGIRYLAIYDNFDSEEENFLAPFQFAINDVYLRDSSKKIKTALHTMMDRGEYCFRAPYGYKKSPEDNHLLLPDEETAPVVKRIFRMASQGYSTWAIAEALTMDNVFPPLKYRVLKVEGINSGNATMMSDEWNNTTVKRILKNPVYLGHTMLGKSKKVSPKSDVKLPLPQDQWRVTLNTHEALVSSEDFEKASRFLGKRTKAFEKYEHVRKSIFGGIAYCASCGAAMCSSGTVYNGEREKYWYLSCQNIPKRSKNRCEQGARIKYDVLTQAILQELNELVSLDDDKKREITLEAMKVAGDDGTIQERRKRIKDCQERINAIDSMTMKLYEDMYAGRLEENRANRLLDKYQAESEELAQTIQELENQSQNVDETKAAYDKFFSLTERFSRVEELSPEILSTFIDRIEIEPKRYPPGTVVTSRAKVPYEQTIHIYYKFIGKRPEIVKNQPA